MAIQITLNEDNSVKAAYHENIELEGSHIVVSDEEWESFNRHPSHAIKHVDGKLTVDADYFAQREIQAKVLEYKRYLESTDFYMLVDKYATLDDARKEELLAKRSEARAYINAHA